MSDEAPQWNGNLSAELFRVVTRIEICTSQTKWIWYWRTQFLPSFCQVSAKFLPSFCLTVTFQGVERSIWEWVIFKAKFLTIEDALRYFFAVFVKENWLLLLSFCKSAILQFQILQQCSHRLEWPPAWDKRVILHSAF